MDRESVLFIAQAAAQAIGRLLFTPDSFARLTDAAGRIVYAEGRDYSVDRSRGCLVRLPHSAIPIASAGEAGNGLTHAQLCLATYTHRDEWRGSSPVFAGAGLRRSCARLQAREPVTVCLTGDSISEGYDASGFHGFDPHQPPFGSIVADSLREHYGAEVRVENLATAGWTAADAVWDVDRITATRPDLVIVAYGMNDAAYAEADEFRRTVSTIVAKVRDAVPDAEFVLVSPMLPTAECTWVVPSRFDAYRETLQTLAGPGIAVADVTSMWHDLARRKDLRELSGNWLNHPNDFGHRVYAQVILAVLGAARIGTSRS